MSWVRIVIKNDGWTLFSNGQVDHDCSDKRSIGWMSGRYIVDYCGGCRRELPEYLQFIQRLYLL